MLQKLGFLKQKRMPFAIDCCDAPGQGLRSFTLFNTVIENAIKEEVVAECAGCRFLLPCLCQFLIVSHVSLLWFDTFLISCIFLSFSLSLSLICLLQAVLFSLMLLTTQPYPSVQSDVNQLHQLVPGCVLTVLPLFFSSGVLRLSSCRVVFFWSMHCTLLQSHLQKWCLSSMWPGRTVM